MVSFWYTGQAGNITNAFSLENQGSKDESPETWDEAVLRSPGEGAHLSTRSLKA